MRFYEWLLRAYPAWFRDRYADAMRGTFAHEYAEYSATSAARRANFWFFTTLHALCFGTLERFPKGPVMRSFFAFDLRDAVRSLKATPVITSVALLSLALGIGANTALFSILNGLVLKPLPVKAPDELVLINDGSWTNPIWEALRARVPGRFAGAFAWSTSSWDLATAGKSDPVEGIMASAGVFDTLGVAPALGRGFVPDDDKRGMGPDGPVAVISHRLWESRYASDPLVLGRSISLNRKLFTIIGVMPAGFTGPDVGRVADVIVPIAAAETFDGKEAGLDERSRWWLEIMLRRAPGQSAEQATAILNDLRPVIRAETTPRDWKADDQASYLKDPFTVIDGATGQSSLRDRFAQPITIILVVVGAVLLIACANIANLLLARATARRHEMSVRLALGASRLVLARQLIAESAIIAIAGAALGLVLAQFGSALLIQQLASSAGRVTLDTAIDWRVLGFTSGVAFLTTMLFGLAPAFGVAGVQPQDALKEQSRSVTGDRRMGIRNVLVVAQVALSLTLVVAAGLFVRSFATLATTPLGFDPKSMLIVDVNTGQTQTPIEQRAQLYERVREAVASVPGVRSASASFMTPLSGSGWNGKAEVVGGPKLTMPQAMIWLNAVTPGCFETYGLQLRAGRDLSSSDLAGREQVVVVNETFVKRFVGNQNPIGAQLITDGPGGPTPFTIVGVVSDAVYRNARSGVYASAFVPVPQAERLLARFPVTASLTTSRGAVERGIGDALMAIDPMISFNFRDLSDQVRASLAQERLVALLSGFFGVLALLLAALGLYGVTSYSVSRRRNEIAVRMALGANAGRVVAMVIRGVTLLVASGVVVGLGITLWASKFAGKLLFGLTPTDPMTFVAAALVLLVAGILAGWLPARRAARLDPTTTLRD